jgi:hypothetical protein
VSQEDSLNNAQSASHASDSSKSVGKTTKLTVASGEKLELTITLAETAQLDLRIQKLTADGSQKRVHRLHFANPQPDSLQKTITNFKLWSVRHAQVLLIILALLVYLSSRFVGLDRFPIYFFTDEAIQTNQAADLVNNGFDSDTGEFLPTYLVNGNQYNLGPSVYIQVIPYLIFGKSVWATRGICVLFTLLAALALGLISRNIFNSSYPFLAILILCATPAWFIHSRTAFETALAVSFYAAFIYSYLMYRKGTTGYLYPAVVFAALTFYSYSPAQVVMVVTVLGLLLSDLHYHLHNWKKLLPAVGVGLVLTLPYVRFLINHPTENFNHLQILNSYWTGNLTFWQKLGTYFTYYLRMLNPYYWFVPNQIDLVRHIMKGYGNLLWWSLPIVALGLVLTCLRLRKSEYRLILIAILAAPSGAALAGVGITRTLFMVVPAVILAAIAVDQLIEWLRKIKVKPVFTAAVCLVGLIGVTTYMLHDALDNGPFWYSDYGLGGMQYGSQQLFGKVKEFLRKNPQTKLVVSSAWANGTDVLVRYFFRDPAPFQLGSIEQWLLKQMPLDNNYVFVAIPEEMKEVQASDKLSSVKILQTIDYPNGQPGFYFVKVSYVNDIAKVFSDEIAARHTLSTGQILLPDGTPVSIEYPKLDMGKPQDAFDGNPLTLIRTAEANPMILKLAFASPYPLSKITLRIGGAPTTMDIDISTKEPGAPLHYEQKVPVSSDYRNITFAIDPAVQADEITITIKNSDNGEPDHVHLWEVTIK